jgi:hypothetical protein
MDDIEVITKEKLSDETGIKQGLKQTVKIENLKPVTKENIIIVADNTFKIPVIDEQVFYYAFAKGDKIIFDFEEKSGKSLKEIEIIEYPSTARFSEFKKATVHNKTFDIANTGIYKFRFSNSALAGRTCKLRIQRIPANKETFDFDTNVYWETIKDTTYYTVQETYVRRKYYEPVEIMPSSNYYLGKITSKSDRYKASIPIILPQNTVEWYYTISAFKNTDDIKKEQNNFSLMGQLANLIDQTGILNFGVNLLSAPPGGDFCDVYLLNRSNRDLFMSNQPYRYDIEGSRKNVKSAVVKSTQCINGEYYLGLINTDERYGLNIIIEVVAIVEKKDYGTRDVEKMRVNSKKIPYIKE